MPTLLFRGRVVGKTIVLESEPGLPEGAPVEVEIHYHESATSAEERLRLVQELFAMNLPVADWEQMERETIRGVLEE
ncbi:MAG: hypothetical protein N2045_08070 [Fimbriimonadales bacterium]|jgi:hypothetical protein|nr:hypothetical protein [Armatimonadota bacterium]MCX7687910.1 hypothetical protein [Fimbriimonadales bacterium]CUU37420.1 hypothetical protein DCOP10_12016 [Armatimonadetes bacterium DC]